jgi:hypothetical protein
MCKEMPLNISVRDDQGASSIVLGHLTIEVFVLVVKLVG